MISLFFIACAFLLSAAFFGIAVFGSHHGGYWMCAEIPLMIACALGAVFSLFLAAEEVLN